MKRWAWGVYGVVAGLLFCLVGWGHIGRTHYNMKTNSVTGEQWPAYLFIFGGIAVIAFSIWIGFWPIKRS